MKEFNLNLFMKDLASDKPEVSNSYGTREDDNGDTIDVKISMSDRLLLKIDMNDRSEYRFGRLCREENIANGNVETEYLDVEDTNLVDYSLECSIIPIEDTSSVLWATV